MMNAQPTVMIVTAECWPLAKTGGLGDMVYSIATSLRDNGFHVRVLLPGYSSVLSALHQEAEHRGSIAALGYRANLLVQRFDGMELVVVRCDPLFDRPGNIYMEDYRTPWNDNAKRFGVLCHAAASIVNGATSIDPPDILHLQDWHAALTPAYIDPVSDVPVVLTVQNFMFQGRCPKEVVADLELQNNPHAVRSGELFSGFSFLQVGLHLADVLTTNSPGYLEEIKGRGRHVWHFIEEKDLARLIAIKNWPEVAVWNPASDLVIPAQYDAESIERRIVNKMALERRLGWATSDAPILCTLSRITKPKGFRFLLNQVRQLLDRGCRLVIVGDGDGKLINAAHNLAAQHPDRVALMTPYCEEDARLILSSADILLMPSLTEPCGLSQQHAQIYGCVPIVSTAGGLPDTVSDGRTGFLFKSSSRESFLAALDRALAQRHTPRWRAIQRNCMLLHPIPTDRERYAKLFLELHFLRKAERAARLRVPTPLSC